MFFTFVVRPGEAPEGRGPQLEPFWTFFVNYNLRLGLLIQLTAYATLLATTSSGGKDPLSLLSFFRSNPESVGKSPLWAAQLACCLFILGNLTTMAFQSLTDDDSSIKQSRGYRSGTKFLQQASSFGLFASTLALLVFYSANYYFDDPWMSKNFGSGSSWLIFFTSRVCDAFALFFYAGSIFFLEAYHSEGAGEAWGWLGAICFKLAAFAEIAALAAWGSSSFEVLDAAFTVMLGVSLSIAFLWSLFFEPASHRFDVRLTQSAMRNEYYKSRNAMAYYGPAVVNADGEIDIAAAAEQAQARTVLQTSVLWRYRIPVQHRVIIKRWCKKGAQGSMLIRTIGIMAAVFCICCILPTTWQGTNQHTKVFPRGWYALAKKRASVGS